MSGPAFSVDNSKKQLVASAASATAAAVIATSASAAATAGTALLRLEAIAAEYRTIASGLKRNRGLLAASGTNYGRSSGCARGVTAASASVTASATAAVAATSGLVGLLGLSARLAALRRRISPFRKERLVSSSKCKFPPAVATGELQISSHCVSPFSVCENPWTSRVQIVYALCGTVTRNRFIEIARDLSIFLRSERSAAEAKVEAIPFAEALPVRPMRWTKSSATFGIS